MNFDVILKTYDYWVWNADFYKSKSYQFVFWYHILTYQPFCFQQGKKGCNYLSYFDIPNIILDYPNPLYLNVIIF